jgi:hypothetical protein
MRLVRRDAIGGCDVGGEAAPHDLLEQRVRLRR